MATIPNEQAQLGHDREILFVVASRRDFHSEFGIGDFDLKEFLQDSRREVREQLNQQFREAWDTGDP